MNVFELNFYSSLHLYFQFIFIEILFVLTFEFNAWIKLIIDHLFFLKVNITLFRSEIILFRIMVALFLEHYWRRGPNKNHSKVKCIFFSVLLFLLLYVCLESFWWLIIIIRNSIDHIVIFLYARFLFFEMKHLWLNDILELVRRLSLIIFNCFLILLLIISYWMLYFYIGYRILRYNGELINVAFINQYMLLYLIIWGYLKLNLII